MKTLKREDFKRIHAIACNTWQPKLIEWYGGKFAVQDEVEVKDSEYKLMREACTEEQHKLFDEIFGKEQSILDKVKSVDYAMRHLGEKDEDVQNLIGLRNLKVTDSLLAYTEAVVFYKAINEGWFPDYNDTPQYKYYVYGYRKDGASFGDYCWSSRSSVSARQLYLGPNAKKNLEEAVVKYADVYKMSRQW